MYFLYLHDVYLNIFCRKVTVKLNQQQSVYYGENYVFDPYDLIVDAVFQESKHSTCLLDFMREYHILRLYLLTKSVFCE